MHPATSPACTAFGGTRLLASGSLIEVARAAKSALDAGVAGPLLVFDDASGRPVEIDFRGGIEEVLARLRPQHAAETSAPRGPGRPKLGVVAREVTLLPRHWEWLAAQPGGASAVLRRLVEEARRHGDSKMRQRQAEEAVDRFMLAMTCNYPGHEEASRAFWRDERAHFAALTDAWPVDVRDHLQQLAAVAWAHRSSSSDEPAVPTGRKQQK